jgi:AcrR family transcriptional regulator
MGPAAAEIRQPATADRVSRRRARVRRRILDVTAELIAERDIEAVTIEEIAEAADIARRSFYHHFESKHDLLVPLARARTKSLNQRIDRLVATMADPAAIMATAMRHGLRELTRDPLCRWFVLKSGLPQERLHEGLGESAMRDLKRGIEAKRFDVENPEVMRHVLQGAFVAALSASAQGALDNDDRDAVVEYLLRVLGVSAAEARKLTRMPLKSLPRVRKGENV